MILGYTLTNIPQKFNTDQKQQKKNLHQVASQNRRGPCINLVENHQTTGFLHRKETTEQNKEGGNSQPSK